MLEARMALLTSGAYGPIAAAIVATVTAHTPRRLEAGHADSDADSESHAAARGSGETLRVVDLGCGTGYYAAAIAEELAHVSVLLADRSPTAVRLASRAVPGSTGVVLDLWRPLPIQDATADVAINVFAPRNASEFARIVRTDGILIVVVPTAAHFAELRRLGLALEVPGGKAERITEQFSGVGFERLETTRVEYLLDTDTELRGQLVEMGPAAHHQTGASASETVSEQLAVTVSVDVVTFARGAGAAATQ